MAEQLRTQFKYTKHKNILSGVNTDPQIKSQANDFEFLTG